METPRLARTARRALLASLALFAAAATSPARADPPTGGAPAAPGATDAFAVPPGVPIGFDGEPLEAEWSEAARVVLSPRGPAAWVKQVRGALLLALVTDRPWPDHGRFVLYARPAEGGGTYDVVGACRIDLEPREHDRPHVFTQVRTAAGWERRDGAALARFAGVETAARLEASIPLALLGAATPDDPSRPRAVRWMLQWVMPGQSPSYVSFPQGLDLNPVAAGLPRDFATCERWATTTGFERPDGPGAFAKSDWTAWVEADRELTRRGEEAHRRAVALIDDFAGDGDGDGDEPAKHDAQIEGAVLDNLRWVGEREPWTLADLRAVGVAQWRLNRYDEAVATLEAAARGATRPRDADGWRLLGLAAHDAERFETAAQAYEALAARLPENLRAPYVAHAARARTRGAALATERAHRAADATRDDLPLALFSTSRGDFVVALLEDDVRNAVAHFVHLVERGDGDRDGPFYDGTRFHRVVANGVAQGGDPVSRREDGPAPGGGGSVAWIEPETNARHGFFRGAVGFAMGADRRIRSQFFVTTAPKPVLGASGFTCFGTVVAGMDVVDRLEANDVLRSVRVLRKRPHAYERTVGGGK